MNVVYWDELWGRSELSIRRNINLEEYLLNRIKLKQEHDYACIPGH